MNNILKFIGLLVMLCVSIDCAYFGDTRGCVLSLILTAMIIQSMDFGSDDDDYIGGKFA